MSTQLFEVALGIKAPWSVKSVEFDEAAKRLTVLIDFEVGTRFAVNGHPGEHPVHDTVTKTYRHLNFFQHECHLQVRVPRVRLPHGAVRQIDPDFAGRLNGFTLLFEALILMLAQQMPFAAVGRIVGESEYRVLALCRRYVHIAGGLADYSAVTSLAIDETSRARGHQYVTIAADAEARRVVFVGEGRGAQVVAELAEHMDWHGSPPVQIDRVSIDMSAAYIKGVTEHLPNAQITFDKFHVIAHASAAVDKTRRLEQRIDPELGAQLKGMRWTLLKDVFSLKPAAGQALHALLTAPRLTMTYVFTGCAAAQYPSANGCCASPELALVSHGFDCDTALRAIPARQCEPRRLDRAGRAA